MGGNKGFVMHILPVVFFARVGAVWAGIESACACAHSCSHAHYLMYLMWARVWVGYLKSLMNLDGLELQHICMPYMCSKCIFIFSFLTGSPNLASMLLPFFWREEKNIRQSPYFSCWKWRVIDCTSKSPHKATDFSPVGDNYNNLNLLFWTLSFKK